MRKVIVTVGPRACGKSDFCEKAITIEPAIVLISRDKLLVEMFGSTSLNAYSGGHFIALERMWEMVSEKLRSSSESIIILDTWNGSSEERSLMIRKLRDLGTNHIEAWYFITPVESVDAWFWKKPGVAKIGEMRKRQGEGLVFYSEDAPRRDYELFHQFASRIDSDGFDRVIRINPLAIQPEHVLDFQTSLNL